MIWQRLRYRSMRPKLMYGKKAKDRKKPEMKPHMWAKLSIQGNSPKAKRKSTTHSSLVKALQGCARICQLWNNSTNRQARIPNWEPAGPTCYTDKRETNVSLQKCMLTFIKHCRTHYYTVIFLQWYFMNVRDWWSPLLCRAGRWLKLSCQWCHWGCKWLRCAASPPVSPSPSGWSSGKPPTPGSEGSWEDREGQTAHVCAMWHTCVRMRVKSCTCGGGNSPVEKRQTPQQPDDFAHQQNQSLSHWSLMSSCSEGTLFNYPGDG